MLFRSQEAQARAPRPRLVTDEDCRHHRHRAMQGLVAETDERVVTEWYASHPQEAREELEFWNTRAAERAERRVERREDRAERWAAKEAAKAQLHLCDSWATDDPRWAVLEDDISDDTDSSDFDWDLSSDEDF